jgi:hypothetical protein
MKSQKSIKWFVAGFIMAAVTLFSPSVAFADGGPILSDPDLWALLEEGQQIAVIRLGDGNQAQVDLFISILDRSGESHEIVFFLPLGEIPFDFQVEEINSRDFDERITQELDEVLFEEYQQAANYKSSILVSFLPGTMLINGSLSWPIMIWLGSSSCASQTVTPISSYQTDSSQIDIYDVNEKTDLEALIETTGLDPAVRETLENYRGQQIAVINFLTQLPSIDESDGSRRDTGQPGIHLSWKSNLVSTSQGTTYTYPLGTGSAWANPIELTRVYVVAPPDIDFRLLYPELGEDLSGYKDYFYGGYGPRILEAEDLSFAVENAVGEFGRIWRATYMFSNASENILITRLPELSSETLASLQLRAVQMRWLNYTWMVSLIVGLAVWLVVWRYTMPNFLGVKYQWQSARLYRDAIGWSLLFPVSSTITFIIFGYLSYWAIYLLDLVLRMDPIIYILLLLILFIPLVGGVNIFFFARWAYRKLEIPKSLAAKGYLYQVLIANAAYLLFVICFSLLAKAL